MPFCPPALDEDGLDERNEENEIFYDVSKSGDSCTLQGMISVSKQGMSMHQGVRVRDDGFFQPRVRSVEDLDFTDAKLLGQGSSGKAYSVKHTPSGEILVVKKISVFDAKARAEIVKELEALHSGRSRFICQFYGAFFQQGNILIALEKMDGSLQDALKVSNCVPEAVLRAVTKQVLQGLIYLHKERHLIHRDIKPGNLLFNAQGEIKITDFGISSKLVDTTANATTFVGTVKYMSPERLVGEPYGTAADVWGLGISLVEAATGKHPYGAYADLRGEAGGQINFWDAFSLISDSDPPSLPSSIKTSTKIIHFSQAMQEFVALCCCKNKESRASALELVGHEWMQQDDGSSHTISKWAENTLPKVEEIRKTHTEKATANIQHAQKAIDNLLALGLQ